MGRLTMTAPDLSLATAEPRARPLAISTFLLLVAGLVFAMVVVGGITRLTESGLSITEWNLVSGALPPLTHVQWQHEFDLYQQTPQYLQVSGPAGMTLAGFKFIFFWEWVHRLLGRILGLIFFFGVVWFALRRQMPRGYGWRLAALFVLGGLQGAVGWFMVMSGLEGRTEVSPYRLSAHLLFALFLFSALIWTALDLRKRDARPARLTGWGTIALLVVGIQLLLGAWVAGFRAGYVSNSWPDMSGHFLPEGIDWSHGVAYAITHDPYPPPLHAPLVGVGGGCGPDRFRAQGPEDRAAGLDRDPHGLRHPGPARHSDGVIGHRDLARGAPPGGRRAGSRRNGVGGA